MSRIITDGPINILQVRQFVERHSSVFTAGELAAIGGAQENIAASITWTAENEASVEAWLNENFGSGNGAAAITSSLVVLISVILAIFNN